MRTKLLSRLGRLETQYEEARQSVMQVGSLKKLPDDFVGGAGAALDIDLRIGDLVLFKEPFGFAAIAAPGGGIHQHMHFLIIPTALLCA